MKSKQNFRNKYLVYSLGIFSSIVLFFIASRIVSTRDSQHNQNRLDFLTEKAIQDLNKIPFDSAKIPRSGLASGSIKFTNSKSWTSGFYAGTLWQLYSYSKNNTLKKAAIQWQSPIQKEQFDSTTHDLGFKIFCSFGNAYRNTKNQAYKEICITAAKSLSKRFNPKVGAIRSWDHHTELWQFPVIIDNMMNLELLFEASKYTGDSSFYKIANQHAQTTLKNHFRKNNSSYHVVDYNPTTGAVIQKMTHQGASNVSSWSRGQAWGLYGFTVAYRYTKNDAYLAQAKKIANFIFTNPNLPDDFIPYWDFDAPNIPNEPRDVSAATIAASGLLELAQYDHTNSPKYLMWASKILSTLEEPDYQSNTPPFILNQSVGSVPGNFEVNVPIIYADYYYIEALQRMKELTQAPE